MKPCSGGRTAADACPDVHDHDFDDDDQDADARPDVRAESSAYASAYAAAAGAAAAARDAVADLPRRKLGAVALADLFLRLLRGAHDGADYGDVESNCDGSPDARGDVHTDARDGGAVLRADDGHLRAIGRAGHGGALGFRSADRRADDGADAADSLDGGDDDIRRDGARNPIPFSSSSSSSSSLPRA